MASLLEHTVKPSGGDFTNLYDACDHIRSAHANLIGLDVYATIKIDGTWSSPDTTSTVPIDATILTDATHYLRIYTTAAARFVPHSTAWQTGAYILAPSATDDVLRPAARYVYFDGLQVAIPDVANVGGLGTGSMPDASNQIVVSNCVFKGAGGSAANQYFGLKNWGNYANLIIYNTIIYNIGTGKVTVCLTQYNNTHVGTMKAYSMTIIGGDYGVAPDHGTPVAKNVYCGGQATKCYNGSVTKTNCASSDATADGTAPVINVAVSVTADSTHAGFVNVTPGSEDFHIKAGSPLIGVGVDTHGEADPLNFTVDIDGDARS